MRHMAARTRINFASFFMATLRDEILSRRQAAEDHLSQKRDMWDVYERLFHNQLTDLISANAKSQVSDPKLATLVLESSFRTMAQLATGKVRNISKNDIGSSLLMNLVVDKYFNKNANAQFDLLTKFRMTNMYSKIYGVFFNLIDWDVKKNGYVGPDIWLLNIRDVYPQVGAVSIDDSDYVIVRTWKPLSYFEGLRKQDGFKNIDKVVSLLKDKTDSKQARDNRSTSKREENHYPKGDAAKNKGFFEVLSQYEGDRWVDFCVDADTEFRDTKNQHDNGELPVVEKYSIPLVDDFFGMGDFERGAPMQMAIDSNWNLYFDAVKLANRPPIAINQDAVASKSSIQYIAAAKWLMRTGQAPVANSIHPVSLSPQGISTFNNTHQVANASLLNMFGTTDTTVTEQIEAGFGKTPQALKNQERRENTRDNADRYYTEKYLAKVYKKVVNLFAKKQTGATTVRMFEDEIEELARSYEEVRDMYDEKTGKLTIRKKNIGSSLYDWEIVSGSTYALDQKSQADAIQGYVALYLQSQSPNGNVFAEALSQSGYDFNFGELVKKGISNSGISDWDKILIERTPTENADQVLAQNEQQFQMAVQQMMNGGMNQTPSDPMTQQPVDPTMAQQGF